MSRLMVLQSAVRRSVLLAFSLGTFVLAPALTAQTSAVLGQKNEAFLLGLWRAGYVDYADRLGMLVAQSNLTDKEKGVVGEQHRKLKIAIAQGSGDAVGRRDLALAGLDKQLATLQTVAVPSDDLTEVLAEVTVNCRVFADAVAEALKQDKPPEELAAIRKAADEKLKAVIADLQTRRKAYEPLRDEEKLGTELPLLMAHYALGRINYYLALVHPADSLHAKHAIETSVNLLEDFELEFSESMAVYEAKLTMALCHQFLGEKEAALSDCDDAISLRERYGDAVKGVYQVDKEGADVIAAAYVQKILFLKDQKEWAKIDAAAKDYLATIKEPLEAQQGPAVLAALAEAQMNLGETDQAKTNAQKLVDLDPKGRWGYRGQELLFEIKSGLGTFDKVDVNKNLRQAEAFASQGDFEKALTMCREALNAADVTKEEGKNSAAEALLITGAVFASRGWLHEASVAWDAVVARFPKSPSAPDALYRTVTCFSELYNSDKIPAFKRMVDERGKRLTSNYPTDQRVPQLLLLDGQQLDRAGKFLEAAKVFENIPPESAVYLDARYYAATCYQKHARKLEGNGTAAEISSFATKAKTGFQGVIADVVARLVNTSDPLVRAKLESVQKGTTIALAGLLLAESNSTEADKLLAAIQIKDDDKQAPTIWALRIRSLVVQGKVDDAADALDAALVKAPEARPLVPVCRAIAGALDSAAVERNKKKERTAASTIWRRATGYYIKGATGATATEIGQIADRLRIVGMILNDVDEKAEGWFEVIGNAVVAPQPWEAALELYTRLAEADSGNFKTQLGRARILGLMGRLKECEAELAQLFSKESIVAGQRLDTQAINRKPELLMAYLEWGYALLSVKGGDEKTARVSARDKFNRVVGSVGSGSKHWWFARYGQIAALVESGLYQEADVSMKSIERTNPELDGNQYGLQLKFRQLKLVIASKVPK